MSLDQSDQLADEARYRQQELLAEADRRRLVKLARAGQPSFAQRLFSALGRGLLGRRADPASDSAANRNVDRDPQPKGGRTSSQRWATQPADEMIL